VSAGRTRVGRKADLPSTSEILTMSPAFQGAQGGEAIGEVLARHHLHALLGVGRRVLRRSAFVLASPWVAVGSLEDASAETSISSAECSVQIDLQPVPLPPYK
jgi:hypothetical protein